jgi:ATP-dependent Clp protease ATP-binding subunit ClpC
MAIANQQANELNHEYIGTEHLLLGLVIEGSGAAAEVFKNLKIDPRSVRAQVERLVGPGKGNDHSGSLAETPRAKSVIKYAIEEARALHHNYIGTEHILLGLLREGNGVAAQVLMNLELNLNLARAEVLKVSGVQDDPAQQGKVGELPYKTGFPDISPAYRLRMLLRWIDEANDPVTGLLASMGVDLEELRRRAKKKLEDPPPET